MTIKQRDRNVLLKNQSYGKVMDNLIKTFQSRDTNANIKKIVEQLENIDLNTQRKALSMYKIKQMMDQEMKEYRPSTTGTKDDKKLIMSDDMKCHFKSLTSFINAYRMKMTQSASTSTAAMAAAVIGNTKRNEAEGISLEQMTQMNKETREGMKAKKKNDDDIKFDFQEFLNIYQLEKYGPGKNNADDSLMSVTPQ